MQQRVFLFAFAIAVLLAARPVLAESPPTQPSDLGAAMRRDIEKYKLQALSQGPQFRLVGQVNYGRHARYAINGEEFDISPDAVVEGKFRIGAQVEVTGPYRQGSTKVANKVVVAGSERDDFLAGHASGDRLAPDEGGLGRGR